MGLVRVSAGRGVLRVTSAAVVISRVVGVAVVVAPVAIIRVASPQTNRATECYARVRVVIPSPSATIVARTIVVTLS